MTTAHMANICGFPVVIPNITIEGDGFYISYNDYDAHIYGSDTTALVLDNGKSREHFYILNGDHRENYLPLIELGFFACFEYFKQNINQINKYSERTL